jgi:hypothetical protein
MMMIMITSQLVWGVSYLALIVIPVKFFPHLAHIVIPPKNASAYGYIYLTKKIKIFTSYNPQKGFKVDRHTA